MYVRRWSLFGSRCSRFELYALSANGSFASRHAAPMELYDVVESRVWLGRSVSSFAPVLRRSL